MTTQLVRFDDALSRAIEFAKAHLAALGGSIVIVRDLLGRIRFVVGEPSGDVDELASRLHIDLGAFSAGKEQLLVRADQMVAAEAIVGAPELRPVASGINVLERWVTGRDWLRPPLPRASQTATRVTFFGIKGGVGRSTALVAVARHLAEQGDRVLVIDLDLESPGVSASLLPEATRPIFGVVDWFAEDDVGQADEALLGDLVASSPLARGTTGEIRVAPAVGSMHPESYVSKLSRIYAGRAGGGEFSERISRLVGALEERERPAWTLIDSRAGIHDVAATAVTRLGATALLFAVDTPQTWFAYRLLFEAWRRDRKILDHFRDDLRLVAGQIPETRRTEYIEHMRLCASELFSSFIYDPADAGDFDAFNFDDDDPDAPHSPIALYWGREFQGWDPTEAAPTVTADQIQAAFGELFRYFDEVLVPEEVDS